MEKIILFCVVLLGSVSMYSQNSQFSGSGSWFVAGSWSNGIPTSATNVSTTFGSNPKVDGIAECNNLSLFLSSLTIEPGGVLTINGQYNATTTGDNTNNGTLILKGTLKPAIGNVVLTVGGGVTSVSGLTFPTFTID